MTAAKTKTLGSVISVSKGKKHLVVDIPSSSSKRLLGIDDLRNDSLLRYTDDPSGTGVLPEDVLIAWDGANAGTIGFGKSGYIGSTIARLRINEGEKIFSPFLGTFLKSKFEYLRQTATGATIPHINRKALDDIELPDVNFHDQIRIAHLLGKVGGLIDQRKQHLQQLDDLLKSVFLKMFGDPVRNEKGWEKKPLEQLGSVNRGVSKHRPRNAPELLGGKYPLIQTGEVSNAGTYITSYSQTYSDLGFAQSKLWPSGTLCITIAANIAQTGILTFDACFPDSVVGFSAFEKEANVLYVHGLFWFFQKILEKNAPAAAQKNINLEILRGLEVPKPPIELQKQFANVVEKIEDIKTRYQHSLTELETLYGALSQHAFKGELDLSRVPLPNVPVDTEEERTQMNVIPDTIRPIVVLPEPAKGTQLNDADQRKPIIDEWLNVYLQQLGEGGSFSTQAFVEAANDLLLAREDETPPWGLADHDQLKTWVFEALASGKLTQAFDEEGNRITLRRATTAQAGA